MSARLGTLAAALVLGCASTQRPLADPRLDPRLHPPASFELNGEPFCFAGANNYYPIYKSRPMVDDLFRAARASNFKVMRIWGALERGSLDGSVPNVDGAGEKDGVYFQYWDPSQGRPAYNDGASGLQHLDYVLEAAARYDIKLIVVLVNNWRQFGGMDQYLTWYGRSRHHEFFTAPEVRQAYRAWVEHVLTRTNSLNGRRYLEDPSVMAWELANEPRCKSASSFDSNEGWDRHTITAWAREMSEYVASLDPHHLVAVGDEGFLDSGGEHWAYRAADGVDHAALTALPHVDFGTFHLYPDHWGTAPGFGEHWILDHLRLARSLGKPTVLEEYGVQVTRAHGTSGEITAGWPERSASYRRWNELMLDHGGNGALAWMLAGMDDGRRRYPDYDQLAFYRDDETGRLLAELAGRFVDAPACQVQPRTGSSVRSPFVRVRGAPGPSALGWLRAEATAGL